MTDWEGKSGTDKTWATCKSYFKELYVNHKRYNKATGKLGFESAANAREIT